MSLVDLPLFDLRRPRSLDELCGWVAESAARGQKAVLYAGGTDWMVEQEMRPPLASETEPPPVFDVSRLAELRGISIEGDRLTLGAATTYQELRRSALIAERAPLLARMAADVGAIQIQARGTLGGNLATGSPAADGVAALAAYDATIVVQSARGERRIPFSALQTGYKRSTRAEDELFRAIEIELPAPGAAWCWRKVGARRAQAISKVAFAAVAQIAGGRVTRFGAGMASVGPVTALLQTTRALALSKPLSEVDDEAVDAAVDADIGPIDDVRSTGVYRSHVARAVVRGFFSELRAR